MRNPGLYHVLFTRPHTSIKSDQSQFTSVDYKMERRKVSPPVCILLWQCLHGYTQTSLCSLRQRRILKHYPFTYPVTTSRQSSLAKRNGKPGETKLPRRVRSWGQQTDKPGDVRYVLIPIYGEVYGLSYLPRSYLTRPPSLSFRPHSMIGTMLH